MKTLASISFGVLLYLTGLAGSVLFASHRGYGTLSAIGPIMLFHFAVGVSTIGGSPSIGADRSQTPQIFVLAGAATLVCSACAVSLAMLIPVWMPPRSALAVICVSWLAGGSLALYSRGTDWASSSTTRPRNHTNPTDVLEL